MKTLIVGAGAMGGLVGALLTESGVQVTLYDIVREQAEAISRQGLIIEREGSRRVVKVHATTNLEDIEPVDLLIVLVKTYDTQRAVEGIRACISPETLVLTLQNGEGNIEAISRIIPSHQVFAGVTSHGAMLLSPGIIRHNGGGKTIIGPVSHSEFSKAEEIAAILDRAGMETEIAYDIRGSIWTKLIVNAAINPLTALIGCTNGELLEDENLLAIMEDIVDEGKKVAAAAGIKVFPEDMFEYVKSVCAATQENKSSMLMDVINHRHTEIDGINGILAKMGDKKDQETPVNKCLIHLVHSLSKKKGKEVQGSLLTG